MRDAGTARAAARGWVEANRSRWPGLRTAHLVGSITTLPDAAPFPYEKDVDLHLVLDEGSPALASQGPFATVVAEQAGGWPIEAGLKPAADYASPELVLGNPEIAHHLTVDSVLVDPDGLLADLQAPVREGYPRRRWLEARLASERQGFAGVLAARPMAAARFGVGGTVMVLGHLMTYAAAAFGIAALGPPKAGSRAPVHLRAALADHGRADLYDEWLDLRGVAGASPEEARAWLAMGVAAFDRAVGVRRTPHPFQHKLHAHLRPYFLAASAAMIADGDHREGLSWSIPFHLASLDVLLADGTAEDKAEAGLRKEAFLAFLGYADARVAEERVARAVAAYGAMFDVADAAAGANPAVVD